MVTHVAEVAHSELAQVELDNTAAREVSEGDITASPVSEGVAGDRLCCLLVLGPEIFAADWLTLGPSNLGPGL
jgi:hypothetical protein